MITIKQVTNLQGKILDQWERRCFHTEVLPFLRNLKWDVAPPIYASETLSLFITAHVNIIHCLPHRLLSLCWKNLPALHSFLLQFSSQYQLILSNVKIWCSAKPIKEDAGRMCGTGSIILNRRPQVMQAKFLTL